MANNSTIDVRVEEMLGESKKLVAELRQSRVVDRAGYGQRVVKAYDNRARRFSENCPVFKDSITGEARAGEFFKAVKDVAVHHAGNWQNHAGMKAYNQYVEKTLPSGMNELQGQDGGFLVPPEFVQQVLMRTYENDLLSRCMQFPMTGNLLNIPAVNETSRADGSRFGGVRAYWYGEAQSRTTSKPGFANVEIKPQSLTLYVEATNEFIEDSSAISVEQFLSKMAEEELNFKIGDGIINSSGTGQMQGVMNAPALITVSAETGQAAATIVSENIIKMYARLHQSCRKNAIWLYDQSIEPSLLTMTIGTAGAQLAVFLPPGGLSDKPYGTILGRPALPVEFCQPLGTAGDIILWDPTTYVIGMRQSMQSAVSIHVYFDKNESVFRFNMRLSGRNWWTSALTPKNAGNTQSCMVNLATRS